MSFFPLLEWKPIFQMPPDRHCFYLLQSKHSNAPGVSGSLPSLEKVSVPISPQLVHAGVGIFMKQNQALNTQRWLLAARMALCPTVRLARFICL